MELIGTIVRLQVQQSSLKVGQAPRRRYDPGPLRSVPELEIGRGGVIGLAATGERIVDVHHRDHPDSKNRDGRNGISVGFTAHYAAIRDRFGETPPDGLAGENVLVETGRRFGEEDLAFGLIVETASGRLRLDRIVVAAPCVEFTRWLMRYPADARPDRTVTEGLRFLDGGMRGFYASYDGAGARIRVGDRVFIPDRIGAPRA